MKVLTLSELLLDLALAFPDLNAQALPNEPTDQFNGPKAWFDRQALMPDDCPVFIRPDQLEGREPLGYSGRVHDGFIAWLSSRGWHVFGWPVDGAPDAHLLVPTQSLLAAAESHESDSHASEIDVARVRNAAAKLAQASLALDNLPPALRLGALKLSVTLRAPGAADVAPRGAVSDEAVQSHALVERADTSTPAAPAALPVGQLLQDLAALLPGIDAQALPEKSQFFPGPKASFSEQVLMPDGNPVYLMGELPGYVDGVHEGFRSWLGLRGWDVLPGKVFAKGTVHLLLPIESIRLWRCSRAAESTESNEENERGT